MTKIALISDVHGNASALQACLTKLQAIKPDRVYFLGDAIGYLPGGKNVLEILAQNAIPCQLGNHEMMMLHPTPQSQARETIYRLQAAKEELGEKWIKQVANWPISQEFTVDGLRFWLIHGSPKDLINGYVYPDTDLGVFLPLPYDIVVMGNTHHPFIRREGGVLFINPGSVGLPRDQGSLGSFAVYDTLQGQCQIYRFPIDTEKFLECADGTIDEDVRACFKRVSPNIIGEILE